MKTPQQTTPGTQAGFTLIETLIAIVVLIFGIIGVSNLFLVATTSNTNASFSTAATTQATEVMERLKAIPFDQLAASPGGDLDDTSTPCEDDPVAPCVVPGTFNLVRNVPGVGRIRVNWQVEQPVAEPVLFVAVRAEGENVLFKGRTTAEFTTFRMRQ